MNTLLCFAGRIHKRGKKLNKLININSSVEICTRGSNVDMCLTNGVTLHN